MRNDFQNIEMQKIITITDTNRHFSASRHWKLVTSDMLFFHGLVILLPQLSFLTPHCSPTWSSQLSHPLLFVVFIFAPAGRGEKGNWGQEWQPCSLFCPTGPSSVCQQWGNALEPNLSTQPEWENKKPECVRKLAPMISSWRPLNKIQNQQDHSEVEPTMQCTFKYAFSVEHKRS